MEKGSARDAHRTSATFAYALACTCVYTTEPRRSRGMYHLCLGRRVLINSGVNRFPKRKMWRGRKRHEMKLAAERTITHFRGEWCVATQSEPSR